MPLKLQFYSVDSLNKKQKNFSFSPDFNLGAVCGLKTTFNEEKEYVDGIKEQLKELTKENLKISYAIEEIKGKNEMSTSKSKFPSLTSKMSVSVPNMLTPIKIEVGSSRVHKSYPFRSTVLVLCDGCLSVLIGKRHIMPA